MFVDLGAQSISSWGPDVADPKGVWHVEGMCSQLVKHMNPKRLIADSKGA